MRKKNILIIDDEPGMLESLGELFRDDFNVFGAGDGREGLRLLKSVPMGLVLLDLRLPGIDGVEVLEAIRRLSRRVPVIIMTAHSTIERAERCAGLTVQGYIRKPFDSIDLLEKVRELLGQDRGTGDLGEGGFMDGLSAKVRKSFEIIAEHYAEPIRPRDVAAQVSASRAYLGKKFKHETGHSMGEHISRLRVEKAKQILLENVDSRLSTIWEGAGVSSESQFLRMFRRYTGKTPAAFRKSSA
ncbi:MAG: response regulator [Thermodesulfobacteriota bacterium]